MSESSRSASAPGQLFLLVRVGMMRLGLFASQVDSAVRMVEVTPLPEAPAAVEGVINYHGTLVPVLDIRKRFGLAAEPVMPEQFLVLLRLPEHLVAIRVDDLLDLTPVEERLLERAPPYHRDDGTVAGVLKLDGGLVIVHDLEHFLSRLEDIELERAIEGQQGTETG